MVQIDAHRRQKIDRQTAAAGGQQIQILRNEGPALLTIPPVERQYQEVTEHIGIAVKGRLDEMGNVRPAPAVRFGQLYRLAVVRRVCLDPDIAERLRPEPALVPQIKRVLLVASQHRLPKDRGEAIFDLVGQKRETCLCIAGLAHQPVEDQHLGEHRRGLR